MRSCAGYSQCASRSRTSRKKERRWKEFMILWLGRDMGWSCNSSLRIDLVLSSTRIPALNRHILADIQHHPRQEWSKRIQRLPDSIHDNFRHSILDPSWPPYSKTVKMRLNHVIRRQMTVVSFFFTTTQWEIWKFRRDHVLIFPDPRCLIVNWFFVLFCHHGRPLCVHKFFHFWHFSMHERILDCNCRRVYFPVQTHLLNISSNWRTIGYLIRGFSSQRWCLSFPESNQPIGTVLTSFPGTTLSASAP